MEHKKRNKAKQRITLLSNQLTIKKSMGRIGKVKEEENGNPRKELESGLPPPHQLLMKIVSSNIRGVGSQGK